MPEEANLGKRIYGVAGGGAPGALGSVSVGNGVGAGNVGDDGKLTGGVPVGEKEFGAAGWPPLSSSAPVKILAFLCLLLLSSLSSVDAFLLAPGFLFAVVPATGRRDLITFLLGSMCFSSSLPPASGGGLSR